MGPTGKLCKGSSLAAIAWLNPDLSRCFYYKEEVERAGAFISPSGSI